MSECKHGYYCKDGTPCALCHEDELAALRAKLQAAEAMVATAHPPKMIRDLVSKLQAAEAENARLHAEVARLREALERIVSNHWTSSAAESMRCIAREALGESE